MESEKLDGRDFSFKPDSSSFEKEPKILPRGLRKKFLGYVGGMEEGLFEIELA